MPTGREQVDHRSECHCWPVNMFDHRHAGNHVEILGNSRLSYIVVNNVPVSVYHSSGPIIPYIVYGLHHTATVCHETRKRDRSRAHVKHSYRTQVIQALKDKAIFNRALVVPPESLCTGFIFVNPMNVLGAEPVYDFFYHHVHDDRTIDLGAFASRHRMGPANDDKTTGKQRTDLSLIADRRIHEIWWADYRAKTVTYWFMPELLPDTPDDCPARPS